jgi:NAD(P)-dependent dehydrogenase (short-subunit alcohol dehydrogenase family)
MLHKEVSSVAGSSARAMDTSELCRIGAAVARRVASEGGKVAIADLNAEAGAALVSELGDHAYFVHCDVR